MSSLKGKTVLVIDDAPDIRLLARRVLEGDGAVVFDASTIDDGIAIAEKKIPHLILTDLNLPVKTGFDFLVYRKESKVLCGIPCIVLSGLNDKASIVRAISFGATDYILKPVRATHLLQKVRKALKVSAFHSRRFKPAERLKASVSISVDIKSINEAGLQIECAIKLAPEQNVKLASDLLTTMEFDQAMTRTTLKPSQYLDGGRYLSEVGFIGIGEKLAKRIRAKLKDLK